MSQLRSRQKQLNNQASGEKLAGESFNIILNTSVLFSLSQTSAFFIFYSPAFSIVSIHRESGEDYKLTYLRAKITNVYCKCIIFRRYLVQIRNFGLCNITE